MVANILHSALGWILKPLEKAGENIIPMARGNGDVHHCHPIHAAHVGDYLEHWAVTGIKLQECPICQVSFDALGRLDKDYPIQDLEQVKKVMEKFHTDPHHFAEAYK